MEYALRYFSLQEYAVRQQRLNPCFNGICSAIAARAFKKTAAVLS